MLENLRRERPLSLKVELEMVDDLIDNLRFFEEGDNSHLVTTGKTTKRIHLADLTDYLGSAFGGHIVWLTLSEDNMSVREIIEYVHSKKVLFLNGSLFI